MQYSWVTGGWTRGSAIDYDGWAELVDDDRFSYKGQLPWLKKAENWFDEKNLEQHGRDGPIVVSSAKSKNRIFPLSEQAAAAWGELGVQALPDNDQNAGDNLGRAYICEARSEGKRQWSASQYPLDGVELRLNTTVSKLIIDEKTDADAVRATGVQLFDGTVLLAKEVILSAGAIRSPQLLQLSGIGSSDELKEVGIESVVDLPDVGKGLSDHVSCYQHWRLRDPSAGYTIGSSNPLFLEPQYSQGVPLDWVVNSSVPREGLIQAITKDEGLEPDGNQHHLLKHRRSFLEYILLYAKIPFPGTPIDTEHVTTALVSLLPTSQGRVSLKSANPEDLPKCECINQTPHDC